ncbi:MAG: hypothetical protein AAFS10_18205, partial [Myxococcota bacterium]
MTLNKNDVKLPAGILFGLVLALALSSSAEDTELDSGPRAVPYNGILEYIGQREVQIGLTVEGLAVVLQN